MSDLSLLLGSMRPAGADEDIWGGLVKCCFTEYFRIGGAGVCLHLLRPLCPSSQVFAVKGRVMQPLS